MANVSIDWGAIVPKLLTGQGDIIKNADVSAASSALYGYGVNNPLDAARLVYDTARDPNIDLVPGIDVPDKSYNYSTETTTEPKKLTGLTADELYAQELAAQQASAAQQEATNKANAISAYNDNISQLQQLLGYVDEQGNIGRQGINTGADEQKRLLNERKAQAMSGYGVQSTQNAQAREQGLRSVDDFANTSYNSLQRLLGGYNAGNSSVARELMPYLVGKASGSRRQGVINTAGQNEQSIAQARTGAENEYNYASQDLDNQRSNQLKSFEESILDKKAGYLSQIQQAEMQRDMANGSSYEDALAASQGTRNSYNDTQSQLRALFGQYKPQYNVKAVDPASVSLNKYTVDPAAIKAGGANATGADYFQSLLKKKPQES